MVEPSDCAVEPARRQTASRPGGDSAWSRVVVRSGWLQSAIVAYIASAVIDVAAMRMFAQ
jgi:hypothetical protein